LEIGVNDYLFLPMDRNELLARVRTQIRKKRYTERLRDNVLREFALRIRKSIRGIDLACRYGGEEFVVVMPETDVGVATMVAERLRRRIASEPFAIQQGARAVQVTISIGIAGVTDGESAASAIKRADQALYRAKRDGRNRVVPDAA
jgi:two-component system cell cycle response regulator